MSTMRSQVRGLVMAGALAMTAACHADSTAPAPIRTTEATHAVQAGGTTATPGTTTTTVQAVGRLGTLGADAKVSGLIGPEGGTLSLPSLGFTLVVPRGAVSTPTNFSVTAVAGRAVAYEFAPHGSTFAKPLTFRQDIRYTSFGWGQKAQGGYFTDRGLVDGRNGKAKVTELLPAVIKGAFIEFQIHHFSGYLVSCA